MSEYQPPSTVREWLEWTWTGCKHVLGVWLGDGGEGAKYWLSVLTEIRNRGLKRRADRVL